MIKLMTYNIMSCKEYSKLMGGKDWNDASIINPVSMADIVKRQNADILVLNEVRGSGANFTDQTKEIADYCGFPYYHFAQAINDVSPYGNAILSKYPIAFAETVLVETTEPDEPTAETRAIAHVVADIDGRKLSVLGAHFGLLDSEKENMLEKITAIVKSSENPVVLMGDFNCMPSSEYSGKIREVMIDTHYEYGDSYSTYIGPVKPHSLKKIDYIYVSKGITFSDAHVVMETASDHFPCTAMIEMI